MDEQTFYIRLASTSQQKVNEACKLHLEKPKKKRSKQRLVREGYKTENKVLKFNGLWKNVHK